MKRIVLAVTAATAGAVLLTVPASAAVRKFLGRSRLRAPELPDLSDIGPN